MPKFHPNKVFDHRKGGLLQAWRRKRFIRDPPPLGGIIVASSASTKIEEQQKQWRLLWYFDFACCS